MSKTIDKDSVVIITTKQAETINRVHIKMLDSISTIRKETYSLAYYKLEAIDRIYDLENSLNYYKASLKIKTSEYENLKSIQENIDKKNKNLFLKVMLILVAWTMYIGIQTQTLK